MNSPQPPPQPGHGWTGRPARSGADTPRSTNVVQHGGKVDPDALLKRIQAASSAPEEFDDAGRPILETHDADQQIAPGGAVDDDAPNRVVFVLQRDLDKRLDKYLTDRITFMSRTQLQRLIDEGGVTVNAKPPKASTRLRAGDRVEVYVPPPPPTEIQPEDIPLNVVFEDDHLIVIDKSPDIIVHPARAHNKGTMLNALAWHFQHSGSGALSGVGKEFARPGVVHRLDRQTSGLIVFAKSDEAHWRLGSQFEKRTVDKRYLAIVHGLFEPEIDTIDLPLGPHPSKERGLREKYVVRHDVLGKPALTIARVRRHFGAWHGHTALDADPKAKAHGQDARATQFSLVELELKTGRTHQIRVHLSHRGFPIAGDDMYGGKRTDLFPRVALHAATLRFRHPADGREMAFRSPIPADLAGALETLAAAGPASPLKTPPGATVPLGPQA
ncbi:MAG TPA: RluA family pseudouridine synthase [Phycisphaerales bacterium]|nr:RluA family pseudouridine synthase [Phycisphaerales bacterium]